MNNPSCQGFISVRSQKVQNVLTKFHKNSLIPGATIDDMKFFKNHDKIVLHVRTNDAPHVTPQEKCNAIKDLVQLSTTQ